MNHWIENIPRRSMTSADILALINRLRRHLRKAEGFPVGEDYTGETPINHWWDEFEFVRPYEGMN